MISKIEKNYTEEAVREMLKKGFEYFSVTRVDPVVVEVASSFLEELEQYFVDLRRKDTKVVTQRFNSRKFGGTNDCHPQVFIIGSKGYSQRAELTELLQNSVEKCPEGILADRLRGSYYKNWGGDKPYQEFMAKARKKGKILQIGVGPVIYSSREMRAIADLFMPDREETSSGSMVGDD